MVTGAEPLLSPFGQPQGMLKGWISTSSAYGLVLGSALGQQEVAKGGPRGKEGQYRTHPDPAGQPP